MKHLLHVILIVFFIQTARAQVVFCPPGAEWHFLFAVFTPYNEYMERIKYVRDSLIGTDTAKVLRHNKLFKEWNGVNNHHTLIKQSGDTVFFRNRSTQHNWQVLYNFNAAPGDSWTNEIIPVTPFGNYTTTTTYTVMVNSVNTVTVNGFVLKNMLVDYLRYDWAGQVYADPAVLTERLGCNNFLFHFANAHYISDGDMFKDRLCYQDSVFGLKQFTEKVCDYVYPLGAAEHGLNPYHMQAYPNPCLSKLHLSMPDLIPSGKLLVIISDVSGLNIQQFELTGSPGEQTLNLDHLSNGLYVITIREDERILYTGKVLKQE